FSPGKAAGSADTGCINGFRQRSLTEKRPSRLQGLVIGAITKKGTLMNPAVKIVGKINEILFDIATALLAISCGLEVVNALSRKFFNMPIVWAEEISTYFVVMMLFLSLAYIERADKALCIGILMSKLKNGTAKKVFRIIRGAWTIAVMGILIRYGITLTQNMAASHVATNILRLPRVWFFSVMVVGFVIIITVWLVIIFARKGGQWTDAN
ncbi:MAG: TRAP transporter small permease, partial [Clostridiales Family XIII bacterium]|nr:TRAP transporter small permease [Clostridiales Family XIII bacterium]